MILLVRGAPGAGKSAVAAAIAARLGGPPHVGVVEVDDLHDDLWHVPVVASMSEGDRHTLALAHAARVTRALLDVGVRLVVVADTFGRGGVAAFTRALHDRAEVRAVSLLIDADEHARRLATRPDVPGVYRDVCAAAQMNAELAEDGGHRIDTTGIGPRDVAGLVLAYHEASRCRAPARTTRPSPDDGEEARHECTSPPGTCTLDGPGPRKATASSASLPLNSVG